jgi:hypothetical protein
MLCLGLLFGQQQTPPAAGRGGRGLLLAEEQAQA